ncbi:Uu.00g028410.m01.CDS01 [Anthostomella pinea]|uniref:Uu.00g028410.m01.CDS01 n=1 Tax=Anthostomella pinea TaxID=933095 RepID=A0AAI8V333_9PEZI|nr:Uu.00g028410.m01.CDS01 [Anthostomella pinea]
MAQKTVLITGCNRGIGKGLLKIYLAKPNHLLIAAVRDPNHPTSKALVDLRKAEGTSLIVVKNDATVPTDAASMVKELASKGIDYIDIVIANAGAAYRWCKVSEVTAEDIQRHVVPNVHGFIWLYQATLPLLKKSEDPIWVTIGDMIEFKNAAYAPTKAVQHWYTRSISLEEKWLTAFPIDPGWAQTDIGQRGADAFGIETAQISVEQSTQGVVKVIDAVTRETHSGKNWVWDGRQVPW